jgi:hypothetical protein
MYKYTETSLEMALTTSFPIDFKASAGKCFWPVELHTGPLDTFIWPTSAMTSLPLKEKTAELFTENNLEISKNRSAAHHSF